MWVSPSAGVRAASAAAEAHGHTGGCPGFASLASHGRATKPHNDDCRENQNDHFENLDGRSKDGYIQRQNR